MGGSPPIPSTPSNPPPNDVGFTSAHATQRHRWWWWLVIDPTLSQMSRTLFGDIGELYTGSTASSVNYTINKNKINKHLYICFCNNIWNVTPPILEIYDT